MDLSETLRKHKLWLDDEDGGERAHLSEADLSEADLSKANLREADLSEANLRWADLSGADLRWANLSRANLREANLSGANLRGADLRWADLRWANLSGANLLVANLSWANLSEANLRGADLRWANLSGANLSRAHLSGANLRRANLRGAKGLPAAPAVADIDAAILRAIDDGGKLDMKDWHRCETTHCRAGWAIALAGDAGRELEAATSSYLAGRLIYEASRPGVPCPDFYATNKDAMEDMRRCAAGGGK